MNIAVIIIIIFSTWKWGDWKNWQKYHPTMLFVALANLLYNFIYCKGPLWEIQPGILQNGILTELLYSFIVFPLTALMFLSNLPSSRGKQALHILKYILIYFIFELVFHISNMIIYRHGWNLSYSFIWNVMMFTVWTVHFKKPLLAYAASLGVMIIVLSLFPA